MAATGPQQQQQQQPAGLLQQRPEQSGRLATGVWGDGQVCRRSVFGKLPRTGEFCGFTRCCVMLYCKNFFSHFVLFRARTVPIQPHWAEPVVAEPGDSPEDAVSSKFHRDAGSANTQLHMSSKKKKPMHEHTHSSCLDQHGSAVLPSLHAGDATRLQD